jgi:MFS family permease
VLSVQLIAMGMKEDNTGLGFSVLGAAVVVASPVVGACSEKFAMRNIMQCGVFLMGIALFLVGPSLFLGLLPDKIWIMFIGLFLSGFAQAMMYIPTAPEIMKANEEIQKEALYKKHTEEGLSGD